LILIFSLAVSFMTNFIRQVNKLLGHNALLLFMTGKYHQPVEEERIFMFLDLNRSTTIAEHLGNIRYHHFLNASIPPTVSAVVPRWRLYTLTAVSWLPRRSSFPCARCTIEAHALAKSNPIPSLILFRFFGILCQISGLLE
jgi:hypothetical protein